MSLPDPAIDASPTRILTNLSADEPQPWLLSKSSPTKERYGGLSRLPSSGATLPGLHCEFSGSKDGIGQAQCASRAPSLMRRKCEEAAVALLGVRCRSSINSTIRPRLSLVGICTQVRCEVLSARHLHDYIRYLFLQSFCCKNAHNCP